jgi:uncharacterized iron-regulated protein
VRPIIILFALVSVLGTSSAQAPPASQPSAASAKDARFAIYTGNEALSFEAMAARLAACDVVFLGELHDHSRGHELQLQILQALQARTGRLIVAMEMFERDVQLVLDEYLAGHITETAFQQAARPWPNYRADYRPIVEWCREQSIAVVASNAPRRYVNMVSRLGADALLKLPRASRQWLPALPLSMEMPADYREALLKLFRAPHGPSANGQAMQGMPSPERLVQAQALWDAAMADSMLSALRRRPGALVAHLNGAMHSDRGHGIVARVRQARPTLRIAVVSIKPDARFPDVDLRAYDGMADFVIITPAAPRTPAVQ